MRTRSIWAVRYPLLPRGPGSMGGIREEFLYPHATRFGCQLLFLKNEAKEDRSWIRWHRRGYRIVSLRLSGNSRKPKARK
jgi:hypothetical protein